MSKREELLNRDKRLEALECMDIKPEINGRSSIPGIEMSSRYVTRPSFELGSTARITIYSDNMEVSRLMTDDELEALRDKINEILAASAIPETAAAYKAEYAYGELEAPKLVKFHCPDDITDIEGNILRT